MNHACLSYVTKQVKIPFGVHLKNIITGAKSHILTAANSAKVSRKAISLGNHTQPNSCPIISKAVISPDALPILSGEATKFKATVAKTYNPINNTDATIKP